MDENVVAKNMRMLRLAAGMTQAECAKKCGVPVSTYRKYEYAVVEPSDKRKQRIANVYGVTVSDLFSDDLVSSFLDTSRRK